MPNPAPAYFDDMFVQAQFDGVNWETIPDVISGSESGGWGIPTNNVLDRFGRPAWLEFDLDNGPTSSVGANGYTPGHANVRSGWTIGLRVRIGWTFDGWTVYLAGRIPEKGISTDPNPWGSSNAHVKVKGWIKQLAEHQLSLVPVETSVKLEGVAQSVLDNMAEQPLNVALGSGTRTFPAAFDTLQPGDYAMNELAKAVISELGWAYTKRDRTDGETFVVEGAYDRVADNAARVIPLGVDEADYIGDQAGNYQGDQNGNYLIYNQTQSADLSDMMLPASPEHDYGDVINYVLASTFPREVRSSQVLWFTAERVRVAAGETVPGIRGSFSDPLGGRNTAVGINVSINSDMTANEDGTGADLSADLEIVSETIGAKDVALTIRNNGASAGWAYLEAEGDGIFIYQPATRLAQDAASIAANGKFEAGIDFFYLSNPLEGLAMAEYIVSKEATARLKGKKWTFLANNSSLLILAFMFLDIGSRVTLASTFLGISGDFVINGMEFWTKPNGILYYQLTTIAADNANWFAWDVSAWDGDGGWGPI